MQILAFGKTQELMNKNIRRVGAGDDVSASDLGYSRRSTILEDPHDQKYLRIFKECQDSAQCIIWWINRALAYI